MAKRGPKPKPPALKIASGAQADRIPAPPSARPGRAEPPPHLAGPALEEWHRIAPEVESTRVMTPADASALAIYCVVFARWLDALREIELIGLLTVSDATGVSRANPAVAIASKCEAQMGAILSSFGLDPASRARVSPVDDPAETDPMGEFIRNRG